MSTSGGRGDLGGVVWLLADMLLVTVMTVFVKQSGASYPALQIVFIRSLIGLISVLPLAWRHRAQIASVSRIRQHVVRVSCNALALTGNFAALVGLPLATANAIGFLRPLLVMVLAVMMLGERPSWLRWTGATIGFAGVLVLLAPGEIAFGAGLAGAFASVVFGSLAVVQTRALAGENTTVMMLFYTVGLTLFTAVPAAFVWQEVRLEDWPVLIAIGILAQAGQYCFLRAYQASQANVLAPIGYLSLIMAALAEYLAFGEVPSQATIIGSAIILAAVALTSGPRRG